MTEDDKASADTEPGRNRDPGSGEANEPGGQKAPEEEEEGRFKRGLNRGLGFLSAFKEAIDETLDEARERGDLNPDRAKDIMRGALDRAQEAAGEAKSRLEFVPRRDFEALESRVAALEDRAKGAPEAANPSR